MFWGFSGAYSPRCFCCWLCSISSAAEGSCKWFNMISPGALDQRDFRSMRMLRRRSFLDNWCEIFLSFGRILVLRNSKNREIKFLWKLFFLEHSITLETSWIKIVRYLEIQSQFPSLPSSSVRWICVENYSKLGRCESYIIRWETPRILMIYSSLW